MDFTDLVFVDDSAEDSDGSEDPPRILTNDDISLFGDVYKYIEARKDEDGRRVCLDLECLVCRDARLEVPPAVSPKRDEDVSIKPMMVLPCGHFFCFSCMILLVDPSSQEGAFVCPMCRFDLSHPGCSCPIDLKPLSDYPNDRPPPTIPEGGFIHYLCQQCSSLATIGAAVDLAVYLLPHEEVSQAAFDGESSGFSNVEDLKNEMLRNFFLLHSWSRKMVRGW